MAFQGRLTVFFRMGNYGWSETIFSDAGDYTGMLAAATSYVNVRQALLCAAAPGFGPQIVATRVSDDSVFRDSYVQRYQPPLTGTFTGSCLPPNVALVVRLTSTALARRPLYLRGLPDSILDGNGAYDPIGAWNGVFNDYRNLLINGHWQTKATQYTGAPQRMPLLSVSAPNSFTLLLGPAPAVGKVVRIGGNHRHEHYPRGVFKISDSAGGLVFKLAGVDLPADFFYQAFDLYLRELTPTYPLITRVDDEQINRRATGRPFNLPRGRRSPVNR